MARSQTTLIVEDPETGEDVVFIGDTMEEAALQAEDYFNPSELEHEYAG